MTSQFSSLFSSKMENRLSLVRLYLSERSGRGRERDGEPTFGAVEEQQGATQDVLAQEHLDAKPSQVLRFDYA